MRLNRVEVAELLTKWLAERKLLDCSIGSSVLEARFRARLFKFDGDVFGLVSDDEMTEVVLEFYFWTEFSRGNSTGEDVGDLARKPLVFLGSRREGDEPDILTLNEVETIN